MPSEEGFYPPVHGAVNYNMLKKITPYLILSVIILAGLALRIYPIMANMPYTYWHDENNYIEAGMRFGTGNFSPMTFSHGGLYQLMLFVAYGVFFVMQKIAGLINSPSDFYINYIKDPTPFFVIARSISIFCSIGITYLTYAIGSEMYNRRTALIAAFFASFSFIMVQMSFFALADMATVFILLAAFLILVRSVKYPKSLVIYCVSCLLVGLASACKYYAIFGMASVCAAAFFKSRSFDKPWRNFMRLVFAGSFFAAVGFIIGMPYLVIKFSDFYKDTFIRLGGEYITRNPLESTWLFYFTHHLKNGLGILLESVTIFGIVYAFFRRSRWDILILSFPIAYYLLFMHSVGFAYHVVPVMPFLFILAARAMDEASSRFFTRSSGIVVVCISILAVIPTSFEAVKFVKVVAGADTRTEAKSWIEDNLSQGGLILAEGYLSTVAIHAPPLSPNMLTLKRDLESVLGKRGSGYAARARISNFDTLYGRDKTYDLVKVDTLTKDDVIARDPAYIIMTSRNDGNAGYEMGYYIDPGYGEKRKALKDYVSERYILAKSFLPTSEFTLWFPHMVDDDYRTIRNIPYHKLKNFKRGPAIYVYKRK